MARIELKIQCRDCKATGLYVGMAERDGCAVECQTCNGTGCEDYEFTYEPFITRTRRMDVTRVFKRSCGYAHGPNDVIGPKGTIKLSQGGVKYEGWWNGEKPKPGKELYCPYAWSNQGLQYKNHSQHSLYKKKCDNGISLGRPISECTHYPDKDECWKEYGEAGGE